VINKHFLGYRYGIHEAVRIGIKSVVNQKSVAVRSRIEIEQSSQHGASPRQSFIVITSDCKGVIIKYIHPIKNSVIISHAAINTGQ
jgi:hypothetical protein